MIESVRGDIRASIDVLTAMLEGLAEPAAQAAELLAAALRDGRRVYVCGDGGSAAQAQHFAAEMVGRFLVDRPALPCIALTTDTSVLTAIANDYDFEQVFERQAEALLAEGDVLVCLSTSGESANVLKAAIFARKRGTRVLGLAGRTGGKLKELSDVCLCVPADAAPRIQEGHLLLLHALSRCLEQVLFAREAPREDQQKTQE